MTYSDRIRKTPPNWRRTNPKRDDSGTAKKLAQIQREYLQKETSLARAQGPHSTPPAHYEKAFRIKEAK